MELNESLHAVALSFINGINGAIVKELIANGYTPADVFGPHSSTIKGLEWLREIDLDNILRKAEAELDFMERHQITPLYIDDESYPELLAESGNPPVVLYMLGHTDLNPEHSLSIVGTRKCTPMGTSFCEKITGDIAADNPETLIVSGLAYGIDSAAHTGALKAGLPTIGVLAHGLDMIYPASHRGLASQIINSGGALLTEYPRTVRPHRNHFLERNRIVATMTQGVLLVESPLKGGAMSTASIAFSYSRDVMAVPGRPSDINSRGCNHLIRTNKAQLIEDYKDVASCLGWKTGQTGPKIEERSLFSELNGDTALIHNYLQGFADPQNIDSIATGTGLSVVKVMTLMTEMEFDGLTVRFPGNRYTLA